MTGARRWTCAVVAVGLLACGSESTLGDLADGSDSAGTSDVDLGALDVTEPAGEDVIGDASDVAVVAEAHGLPKVHEVDLAAAARGEHVLSDEWPGVGLVPTLALRHLYLSWTTNLVTIYGYYTNSGSYWAAFRERYGLVPPVGGEDGLPVGFRPLGDGTTTSVTCLLCHAGRVPGGGTAVGLPNSQLDLQGLYDDLQALPAAFEALKAQPLPEPYKTLVAQIPVPPIPPPMSAMVGRTAAPGSTDAMGLGMEFGARALGKDPAVDGLHTHFGFQNPNAWWTVALKAVRYWDGSVPFGGHRTMMATLLGLGLDVGQLVALDSKFNDVEQFLLTIEPPKRPFAAPEPSDVAAGRAIFGQRCAKCHGTYDGASPSYPNTVVPLAELGTDPVRSVNFGEPEAAVANALIADPAHAMKRTGGYLAQPLTSVWATAPYFHNGAVPDLMGVLDSTQRPTRWRRAAGDAVTYDQDRVGWRYDVVAGDAILGAPPSSIEGRRVVETSQPGMSPAGHTFGDDLSPDERLRLIAYVKTL